jgi:hypothetical protein
MDAAELQLICGAMQWGPVQLHRALGIGRSTVYGWWWGQQGIPDEVAGWLRLRQVTLDLVPPPHIEAGRTGRRKKRTDNGEA